MAVTVGILRDEAGNYFLPQTDASLVSGLNAYTLPAGGQVGQVLAKATSSDYDVHWVNQSGGGGGGEENVIEEIQVNSSPITPVNKVVNIPVPTENTVTSWGFTKNAGTITGITMNGVSKGISGVVDLGTVLTSSDAFELLANKKTAWSAIVSDTNYPSEKLVKDSLDAIHQIPSGGTTGQILKKASNTNYDLVWANESGGGGDPANAVLYTAQSLTAEQQTQARTNIGAGTYSKPSGGIPSTDLASGVIPDVSGFYTKPANGIPATDLESGVIPNITGKADKVTSAINGNFAALDSDGNLTDSGHKHSDYITDISDKEDKSNKKTSWSSTVSDTNYPSEKLVKDSLDAKQDTIDSAHKLDYSLIDNTPTIPAAQVQSDWNQTDNTQKDFIKNKPIIPAAQVQSDWNATTGMGVILNKPTIPAAQVNSDWNASSGIAQILNKPTIPDAQIQSDWNQTTTTAKDYIKNKPGVFSRSATGFVPAASASGDTDKFLKGDGTWATPAGGGSSTPNPVTIAGSAPNNVYITVYPQYKVNYCTDYMINSFSGGYTRKVDGAMIFIDAWTGDETTLVLAYANGSATDESTYEIQPYYGSGSIRTFVNGVLSTSPVMVTVKANSSVTIKITRIGGGTSGSEFYCFDYAV